MSDYTANIRIENFPRELDDALITIALRLNLPKKDVIKLALGIFAVNNKHGHYDSSLRTSPVWKELLGEDG